MRRRGLVLRISVSINMVIDSNGQSTVLRRIVVVVVVRSKFSCLRRTDAVAFFRVLFRSMAGVLLLQLGALYLSTIWPDPPNDLC